MNGVPQFYVNKGGYQNPYAQFVMTLAPLEIVPLNYACNTFRLLDASGVLRARFGGEGQFTEFYAGIGYSMPTPVDTVFLQNPSAVNPLQVTVALGVGFIQDDRLNVSGNINVVTPFGTYLNVGQVAANSIIATSSTVGTTASSIIAAGTRKEILVTNTHASNDLYLGDAGVVVGSGVKLVAGQTASLEYQGELFGISNAAGTTVAIAGLAY